MIRTILGVIVGFVVMLVIQFVALTASYLILGVKGTFEPGTFKLTSLWLVVQAVFTLVAGIIAGKACVVASGRRWALIPFVVFMLVVGLLAAIPPLLVADSIPARLGDTSVIQAMTSGRAPKWFLVLNPFIGAVGILLGGRSRD